MYKRRVTHIKVNDDGEITGLANPDEWGIVSTSAAIFHIQKNMFGYFVEEDGKASEIRIIHKDGYQMLTTGEAWDSANNLSNLPRSNK